MAASCDPASVFEQAIKEHLPVVQAIHVQQPMLEWIAAEIAEDHILCGHMLCNWIERSACAASSIENEAISR